LLDREVEQLEVIIGVVGAGVPRSEDPDQHLPPAGDQQRVKAKGSSISVQ